MSTKRRPPAPAQGPTLIVGHAFEADHLHSHPEEELKCRCGAFRSRHLGQNSSFLSKRKRKKAAPKSLILPPPPKEPPGPMWTKEEKLRLPDSYTEHDKKRVREIAAQLVEGQILRGALDLKDRTALKKAVEEASRDAFAVYAAALEYLCG